MKRVTADKSVCMGAGLCEHISPKNFVVQDGVVSVIEADVQPSDESDAAEAVDSCPTRALKILADG